MTIGDICEIKTNFPEADFWLQRRGSIETVGKPTKEYYEENIGIKVRDEFKDKVDSNYLYYYFMFLHQKGVFQPIAHGTLKLQNIRLSDIKSIPVNLSENNESSLEEVKLTKHYHKRFEEIINTKYRYVVFKGNHNKNESVGYYFLKESEVNEIKKRIESIESIDIDKEANLGVKIYDLNIDLSRVEFFSPEEKLKTYREVLEPKNKSNLYLRFIVYDKEKKEKISTTGNIVLAVVRDNSVTTIYFVPSDSKTIDKDSNVKHVIDYKEIENFKPKPPTDFGVVKQKTKVIPDKPFISGDFTVPLKLTGGKIYVRKEFIDKYNSKLKKESDKIKFNANTIQFNNYIHHMVTNPENFEIGKKLGSSLVSLNESEIVRTITKQTIFREYLKSRTLIEAIKASEAYDDMDSIQTILDGKRDIAFLGTIGDPKFEKYDQKVLNTMDFTVKNGLNVIEVENRKRGQAWVIYKNNRQKAKMLADFAASKNGYLRDETPDEARFVGELLDYDPKDVENYVMKRYGV